MYHATKTCEEADVQLHALLSAAPSAHTASGKTARAGRQCRTPVTCVTAHIGPWQLLRSVVTIAFCGHIMREVPLRLKSSYFKNTKRVSMEFNFGEFINICQVNFISVHIDP
jgi:hypothetical protein